MAQVQKILSGEEVARAVGEFALRGLPDGVTVPVRVVFFSQDKQTQQPERQTLAQKYLNVQARRDDPLQTVLESVGAIVIFDE